MVVWILRLQSDTLRVPQCQHGAAKGARNASEGVVGCGVRPIQANRHARHTEALEFLDRLDGQHWALGLTLVRKASLTLYVIKVS